MAAKGGAAKGKQRRGGKARAARRGFWRRIRLWLLRALGVLAGLLLALIVLYKFVNPPTTPYIFSEALRLGHVERRWTPLKDFAPAMARSVVAAEDANFCEHWGFDIAAIRAAAEAGMTRGGSTIDQQVVKNVFLWQGHSWPRKALEALITPIIEMFWSKRRILEIYLNVAETGDGAFGFTAAAARAFMVEPGKISARQAALLAAVLPDPKRRDAAHPTAALRKRAREIMDGAATIEADGRARCFERK
jgi:monofunctional glycosyltransferase